MHISQIRALRKLYHNVTLDERDRQALIHVINELADRAPAIRQETKIVILKKIA